MRWSTDEVATLKENPLLNSAEFKELLPNRAYDAVLIKRRGLGLNFSGMKWGAWEIRIIQEHNDKTDTFIHEAHLPHRCVSAIAGQRYRMKLRKQVACQMCGVTFSKVNQHDVCHECGSDYSFRHNAAVEGRYAQYKFSAKKRGHCFDLTLDFFKDNWGAECNYCGDDIDGVGFDRVDNKLGYTVSNVVNCCQFCNELKMTKSVTDLVSQMKKILNNLGETL